MSRKIPKTIQNAINRSRDPRFRTTRQHIDKLKQKSDLTIAEVGVWKGTHAKWLVDNLDVSMIYLIDPYEKSDAIGYDDSVSNAKGESHQKLKNYSNVVWVEKKSHEAISEIQKPLDYVYIDADHRYEVVKRDMKKYFSLLDSDGILAGHDLGAEGTGDGVTRAFVEFAIESKHTPYSERDCSDWYFVKDDTIEDW